MCVNVHTDQIKELTEIYCNNFRNVTQNIQRIVSSIKYLISCILGFKKSLIRQWKYFMSAWFFNIICFIDLFLLAISSNVFISNYLGE